jgi:hypothetical protein
MMVSDGGARSWNGIFYVIDVGWRFWCVCGRGIPCGKLGNIFVQLYLLSERAWIGI